MEHHFQHLTSIWCCTAQSKMAIVAYKIAISINLITYRIGNYPIAPFEKQIKCKWTKYIWMRKVKIQNSWNYYENYSVSDQNTYIFTWPLIDYYLQINTSCNTTIKTIIQFNFYEILRFHIRFVLFCFFFSFAKPFYGIFVVESKHTCTHISLCK